MTPTPRFRDCGRFGLALASLFFLCSVGCYDSGPASSSEADDTEVPKASAPSAPNLSFASDLSISSRPVSEQEARRIAELATGGSAVSLEREDENEEPVFEVTVRVEDSMKEVEVRVRDGAVIEIDDDDAGVHEDASREDETERR